MATLRIVGNQADTAWLTGGTILQRGATAITYSAANGSEVVLRGINLTYDADGVPTGGQITRISLTFGGSLVFTWTNVVLSAVDYALLAFGLASGAPPVSPDAAALEQAISAFDDVVFGGPTQGHTRGFAGNDTLRGEDGDDWLYGGDGIDRFYGGNGTDGVTFIDTPQPGTGVRVNLNLTTGQIEDDGHGNTETMSEVERIEGSTGNDTIIGSDNYDTFWGAAGDDRMEGGANSDWLYGNAGNDSLFGDVGVDVVNGGRGTDYYDGGADGDILQLMIDEGTDHGARIDLRRSSRNILDDGFGNTETALNIENFEGTVFGDWMQARDISAGQPDQLRGLEGDDTIYGGVASSGLMGGAGNDSIRGGAGAETVSGGTGIDTLNGGAGTDMLDLWLETFGGGGVIVNLSAAQQVLNDGWGNAETASGFENVSSSEQADLVTGNSGSNWLVGNGGNDTLYGGSGTDFLDGGFGDDVLNGGNSSDHLTGGAGNDVLIAESGNDTLVGGSEADSFQIGARAVVVHIADFASGEDALVFDLRGGLATGNLATAAFAQGAGVQAASTGTQRFVYDTTTGELRFDRDGSGSTHDARLIAVFENPATLDASDFSVFDF